jgi:crotonobetainyl-CoA:carnitine CoA-transferase CaiB-like acyl-CoA transferase
MSRSHASTALNRYTVLDLTRVRAGPTAARQFADWGANVICIETPGTDTGEELGGKRHGPDFQNLHRNTRSITLNLKSPAGVATFKRLVAAADVVLENFRPDVKFRLGIDYESLEKVNPRIVYGSISGFGQRGPYRDRPGFDQILQGMGGIMSVTGLPGQGPVRVGTALADLSSGLFCALGVLVALLERETSGRGQWVQTSLLQAQIFMLDFQAARWLMDHEVPQQAGNDHPTIIPTGVFRTVDGHINIATAGQETWARLCKALDLEPLVEHTDYATAEARSRNRATLNARLAERLATRGSKEWVEDLNRAGVPCGPIYNIDEVFADEQVKALGLAQQVEHPSRGTIELVGQPVDMSRTPSRLQSAAPDRGEHTNEVLREFGFSDTEIAGLRSGGAV